MKIRLAAEIQTDSIVDGEGIRAVIWTQGCLHNCKGCHNKITHDLNAGKLVEIEEVKKEIKKLKKLDGITFSGGEPFLQAEACLVLANFIKELGLNIWCYTGFKYEDILNDFNKKKFLEKIDVLVDGPFVISKRSLSTPFRGSTNQRIIDVCKSLKENKVVTIEKYMKITSYSNLYKKDESIYI